MRKVAMEEENGKYHFELDGGIAGEHIVPNPNRLKFTSYRDGEQVIRELYALRSFNEGERNQARALLDQKFNMTTTQEPVRQQKRTRRSTGSSGRTDRAAAR